MEQIPCEDADLVLAVLEDRLQTLTGNVVREGKQITLFGLGPSPRTMNPRDTTVIQVREANGVTTIDADITFQASAFLGELRQDTIVLEKLNRVFDEMKSELDFKRQRGESLKAAPVLAPPRVVVKPVAVERGKLEPVTVRDRQPAAETVPPDREPKVEGKAGVFARAMEVALAAAPAVTEAVAATETKVAAAIEISDVSVAPVEMMPAVATLPDEMKRTEAESSGGRRRRGWLIAAGFCVAALGGFGTWYFGTTHERMQPQQPAPAAAVAAPAVMATPLPGASGDPAVTVKAWEAAMQGQDAAAQAAFYANPVERYFLRRNVGRDAVAADKQAAIEKRREGWTVTMDRVKVQKNGGTATVNLVKHFRAKADGVSASEWFIPSRLQLRRVDGRWQIVAESDLGWVTSMDDLE
jgi:ketosteroid isomerase-like protein